MGHAIIEARKAFQLKGVKKCKNIYRRMICLEKRNELGELLNNKTKIFDKLLLKFNKIFAYCFKELVRATRHI